MPIGKYDRTKAKSTKREHFQLIDVPKEQWNEFVDHFCDHYYRAQSKAKALKHAAQMIGLDTVLPTAHALNNEMADIVLASDQHHSQAAKQIERLYIEAIPELVGSYRALINNRKTPPNVKRQAINDMKKLLQETKEKPDETQPQKTQATSDLISQIKRERAERKEKKRKSIKLVSDNQRALVSDGDVSVENEASATEEYVTDSDFAS